MLNPGQMQRILESVFPEECEDVGGSNLSKIAAGVTQSASAVGGQNVSLADATGFLMQLVAFISDVAGIVSLYIAMKPGTSGPTAELVDEAKASPKAVQGLTDDAINKICSKILQELAEAGRPAPIKKDEKPAS